jgi:hypothetical protein
MTRADSNHVYVPVDPRRRCEHLPTPAVTPDARTACARSLATTGRERFRHRHCANGEGSGPRERDAVRATLADTRPPYPAAIPKTGSAPAPTNRP